MKLEPPPARSRRAPSLPTRGDDRLDDVKPETQPSVITDRDVALERHEDALSGGWIDTDPVVPDDQARSPIGARDGDLDRLAEAELDRIGEQVGDHLLNPKLVPLAYDAGLCGDRDGRATRSELRADSLHDLLNDVRETDLLEVELQPAGTQVAEIEEAHRRNGKAADLPARPARTRGTRRPAPASSAGGLERRGEWR